MEANLFRFYGKIQDMKITKMLDPRGTKIAYLILAMVLNVAWALVFFSLMDSMLLRYGEALQDIGTSLMLGIFLGALSIGFLITTLAKDHRGPTYGIYGGIAGLVVIVLMTWQSGLLSALIGFMAIFGGINGGTLGEMFQQIQRNKKK
jgi:hypothetical protein